MSEEFDKEAERKRLREKYESDQDDRDVTERMSQLLLQGATMTNKHCDTCGSPIFRYQGQEFCPTCQAEAEGSGQASQSADTQGQASQSADGTSGTANDAESAQTPEESQSSDQETARFEGASPNGTVASATVGAASTGTAELGGSSRDTRSQTPGANTTEPAVATTTPEAVTRSLSETIVSLSDRARETEDPRRAKALLEAAREAADTLVTLGQ